MNYTVKAGESLYTIGNKWGFTIDQILKANPSITNPDFIMAGQVLFLPDKTMPVPRVDGIFRSPVDKLTSQLVPNGWHISEEYDYVYPAGLGKLSGKYHSGVDITQRGCYGKPIYAVYHGTVMFAGDPTGDWGWGNIIVIALAHIGHEQGSVYVRYGHMSKVLCKQYDVVKRGQVIGEIGDGENHVYAPHLHFDCRNLAYRNPSLRSYGSKDWIKKAYLNPHELFNMGG